MLIKKELQTIPILPVPKAEHNPDAYLAAAELFDLPRSGLVLVADVFSSYNKELRCRFFSDGKIYLTCWKWPDGTWGKANPAASSWYPTRCISYKEDTELLGKVIPNIRNKEVSYVPAFQRADTLF